MDGSEDRARLPIAHHYHRATDRLHYCGRWRVAKNGRSEDNRCMQSRGIEAVVIADRLAVPI
jgi:hypothetical protein